MVSKTGFKNPAHVTNKLIPFTEAARSSIEVEQVRFSGTLKFDENGTAGWGDKDQPQFFGPPGPDIDENWQGLIDGKQAHQHSQRLTDSDFE